MITLRIYIITLTLLWVLPHTKQSKNKRKTLLGPNLIENAYDIDNNNIIDQEKFNDMFFSKMKKGDVLLQTESVFIYLFNYFNYFKLKNKIKVLRHELRHTGADHRL